MQIHDYDKEISRTLHFLHFHKHFQNTLLFLSVFIPLNFIIGQKNEQKRLLSCFKIALIESLIKAGDALSGTMIALQA